VATGIPAKEKHKRASHTDVTTECLEAYVAEGNDLLPNILTSDKCWFHYF
jgi:hypothetical protein